MPVCDRLFYQGICGVFSVMPLRMTKTKHKYFKLVYDNIIHYTGKSMDMLGFFFKWPLQTFYKI